MTKRETRASGFTRNTGILPVFAWAGSARYPWGPPSGRPVGGDAGSTRGRGFTRNTVILTVFAWAGSARRHGGRHPGGQSVARDTATQRRRDAHRPALKARGRPCSESRRRMRAQPWMAQRSRLRANGGHDGRSERPATGHGRPRSESFEPSTGRRSRRYAAIKGAKGIKGQSPKGTVSGRTAVVPVIPVQRRLAPTLHSNRSGRSRGRRRGR